MLKPFLLDLLRSPVSGQPYRCEVDPQGKECLVDGQGAPVPIENGIPRFVDGEQFVESFGFQWNRFEVRQPVEDEETFELKTGVRLADLPGLLILDAGCGGGRYTLVAAENGANVVAADRSSAVEKAKQLVGDRPNVAIVQSDLTTLPLRPGCFDLVFSIGVLHHSPETKAPFDEIATMVKPGGRLSVWLYRQNTWPQEVLNNSLRWLARRVPRSFLLACCRVLAVLGGIPVVKQTLNKVANFSNHPCWQNRVCDNFDWYSPDYQHHHNFTEVKNWFEKAGFEQIRELPPAKRGRLYSLAFRSGWIIGSGVNVTGIKKSGGA